MGGFFGWFNRFFTAGRDSYQNIVSRTLHRTGLYFLAYFAVIAAVIFLFSRLPSSFLPEEDQGYFITNIQLPVGATQERTLAVLKQVEKYFLSQPEVDKIITVAGFSFNGRGQNSALSFIRMKDWSLRPGDAHKAPAIIRRAFGAFSQIKDAIIFPVNLPPIPELGTSSGFDLFLEDQSSLGHNTLMQARDQLVAMAAKNPNVTGLRMQGLEDAAQLKINIDENKASALGVSLADINTAMQANFGSFYVNNFVHGNRVQRVIIELDAPFRMLPSDISKVYVRNSQGGMVPLGTFVNLEWTYGSPQLQRYNGFPAIEIIGSTPPGKSTGDAMKAMEEMIKQLPRGIGYEWTGQSYEELLSGAQAPALFMLSLIVVFLALAALYESWSIPFAVMLIVPLGILGSLSAATLRGMPDDVYFKVGLLAIIGLSTKNAILIVEFAKDLQKEGKGLIEATLEAVHLRLRPILMTSLAFILGVTPLALSTGAGSASQHAIGTGVAGGMFTATFLAIFFVPVFYVSVRKVFMPKDKKEPLPEAVVKVKPSRFEQV
jgi:hydrophobe/amphiphile efflux-1 (HAE1) family protein